MNAGSGRDRRRLEAFYQTESKYNPDPVPTPLYRAAAVAFVNERVSRTTPPEKMRKLMRLAVFYNLAETLPAFESVVMPGDDAQIARAAFALIAIAWIGDARQRARAQQSFRGIQEHAGVELQRHLMLEVVEAFGTSDAMAAHREWIDSALRRFESELQQVQAAGNIPRAKVTHEKIKALVEYRNIQLARVDRAFSIRQRTESADPAKQIVLLVPFALMSAKESTPQLAFWASMRLLRMDAGQRPAIAAQFLNQAAGNDLIRARALRAAEFFGTRLPEADRTWLAAQQDTGTDPLALRPEWYNAPEQNPQ